MRRTFRLRRQITRCRARRDTTSGSIWSSNKYTRAISRHILCCPTFWIEGYLRCIIVSMCVCVFCCLRSALSALERAGQALLKCAALILEMETDMEEHDGEDIDHEEELKVAKKRYRNTSLRHEEINVTQSDWLRIKNYRSFVRKKKSGIRYNTACSSHEGADGLKKMFQTDTNKVRRYFKTTQPYDCVLSRGFRAEFSTRIGWRTRKI